MKTEFDPYEMAVYLENILALINSDFYSLKEEAMIKGNAQLALEMLHESFPDEVPNGKKH